mgnify:CR=1 FL=1
MVLLNDFKDKKISGFWWRNWVLLSHKVYSKEDYPFFFIKNHLVLVKDLKDFSSIVSGFWLAGLCCIVDWWIMSGWDMELCSTMPRARCYLIRWFLIKGCAPTQFAFFYTFFSARTGVIQLIMSKQMPWRYHTTPARGSKWHLRATIHEKPSY